MTIEERDGRGRGKEGGGREEEVVVGGGRAGSTLAEPKFGPSRAPVSLLANESPASANLLSFLLSSTRPPVRDESDQKLLV